MAMASAVAIPGSRCRIKIAPFEVHSGVLRPIRCLIRVMQRSLLSCSCAMHSSPDECNDRALNLIVAWYFGRRKIGMYDILYR